MPIPPTTLYQSIFEKGEAKAYAETVIRVLTRWMGAVDPALRERIRALSDRETLTMWYEEALFTADAEGARRLADKIMNAALP